MSGSTWPKQASIQGQVLPPACVPLGFLVNPLPAPSRCVTHPVPERSCAHHSPCPLCCCLGLRQRPLCWPHGDGPPGAFFPPLLSLPFILAQLPEQYFKYISSVVPLCRVQPSNCVLLSLRWKPLPLHGHRRQLTCLVPLLPPPLAPCWAGALSQPLSPLQVVGAFSSFTLMPPSE